MDPITIQLGLTIVQALIKYGPEVAEEIAVLLHSDTPPTLAQWQAIFAKCKSLDEYVAEAKSAQAGAGGGSPALAGAAGVA